MLFMLLNMEKNIKMPEIQESSGNVFADMGLPMPEEMHAKAALLHRISRIIEKRLSDRKYAAEISGISQAEISAIIRGRLSEFSYDQLIRFLNLLDFDVQIEVRNKPDSQQPARVIVIASEAIHPL